MKANQSGLPNVTLVGLHIPKCAGTSLLEMAQSQLQDHQIYQSTNLIRNWNRSKPSFLDIRDPSALRMVWGHSVHEEMLKYVTRPFLFTGLRHPRERLVSEYRWQARLRTAQGREVPPISEWKKGRSAQICNFIVERFPSLGSGNDLFERAQSTLNKFQFVYFTENFERSSKSILKLIGCSSPARRSHVGVGDVPAEQFDDVDIEMDLALYEWAKKRFAKTPINRKFEYLPRLRQFVRQRKDEDALNRFLLRAEAVELVDFNRAEDAVKSLKSAIARKQAVIDYIEDEVRRRGK